ncbi:sperm-associated antigen 7 homolog [Centruroides sculpturatus]|uniref:sperm-associated antigen 7 homolog n=1 Tax=Centruroides sculpturatus TaxID=218467 RepID=UPI000C6CF98E|nr:sperm-associated antigen 7 homolog [Centruroides sculpturatus]
MDLLGSILNSMDKPPTIKNEQKELLKKQKEQMIKRQAADKANLKRFREQIEKRITEFIKDSSMQKFKFEPMDKVSRSIVHDVADVGGLTAFSFGDDEVDRHVMVFKKEFAPSDDELLAYRKGEEWNPEKAKEAAQRKFPATTRETNVRSNRHWPTSVPKRNRRPNTQNYRNNSLYN